MRAKGKEEAGNKTKSNCMLREGILVLLKHTHTHTHTHYTSYTRRGVAGDHDLPWVGLIPAERQKV